MVQKTAKQKSYLTPQEVAELLMVSPTTIRQWCSEGKIKSWATLGGHRRFMRADVERFSRERGLTLQLPSGHKKRVLIVDDDEDIGKYLTNFLRHVSDRVETAIASNGFDAGRLVQSFQPHVVLLDLMMPDMDGFEVCRTIKRDPASKATLVVAMTGYYDDSNVERILDAGAEFCLRKPFDTETLLDAIGIERPYLALTELSG